MPLAAVAITVLWLLYVVVRLMGEVEDNIINWYFGRTLIWRLIFLTATYLFALSKEYTEVNAIEKENKLENNNIRKAWKYL